VSRLHVQWPRFDHLSLTCYKDESCCQVSSGELRFPTRRLLPQTLVLIWLFVAQGTSDAAKLSIPF
jgi:hypothetical protein